jgi:hypothetical protein
MPDHPRDPAERPWLLLIHQIPPKPDYLRVKIGRRLQRVGALAVKNSVYVLPDGDQSLEDFQWIRSEIVEGGGDASICRADFVDGLDSGTIQQLFREARGAEYAELAAAARELLVTGGDPADRPAGRGRAGDDLARLRRRLAAVRAIDFFAAAERVEAEAAVAAAEARVRPRGASDRVATGAAVEHAGGGEYRGRTWVTREGVFVDRIASAWLIRRRIDPEARFRFVPAQGYRARAGELRFDMVGAEFTHEGDRCTFETLLRRFGLDDPALAEIAEIVHDIDLKDDKFEREEAAGIERVLAGIAATTPADEARLARGAELFDGLYAVLADRGGAEGA